VYRVEKYIHGKSSPYISVGRKILERAFYIYEIHGKEVSCILVGEKMRQGDCVSTIERSPLSITGQKNAVGKFIL